jgi:uncharacterized protein (DUF1810 family)
MPTPPNRFDHFIAAQDPVYPGVLQQLRAGRKQGHWMWFIFPQLAELGRSTTAKAFGIADLEEARAYAAHPLLGGRLLQCVELASAIEGRSALEVFGSPDDLKLRSCLTLFLAATGEQLFQEGLERFYAGAPDPFTLELLNTHGPCPD